MIFFHIYHKLRYFAQMIEAIIFDLDGTLVGQEKSGSIVLKQFYQEIKNRFNYLKEKEFIDIWFKVGKRNLNEFLIGKITFEEKIVAQIQELFKSLNRKLSKKEAKALYEKLSPVYKKNLMLYSDVIPCLDLLRKEKYHLGIITNGHPMDQREKLLKFNIDNYFSPIIISGEIGYAKPDQRIFIHCAKKLNLLPQEIIYVGDLIEMDVIGANNAGMKGVWLNRENRQSNFDIDSITNLSELKSLLKHINA